MQTDLKNLILDVLANDSEDFETFEDKWNELNQYLIDSKQSERGFIGRLIKSYNTQGLIPDTTAIQYLHFIEDLNSKKTCTTPTIEFKKTSKTQIQQIEVKSWIVYKNREIAINKLSTKELEAMDKAVSSVKVYFILGQNVTTRVRNAFKTLKMYNVRCLESYKFCLDFGKYAQFLRGVRRLEIIRLEGKRDGFRELLKNCIAKQNQILPTRAASHFLKFTLQSLVINKIYKPSLHIIHTYTHQASYNLPSIPPTKSKDLLQSKLLFKTLNTIWLKRAHQAYNHIGSFNMPLELPRTDHQVDYSHKNNAPRPSILRKHDTLQKYKLVFSLMKIIENRARYSFERLKLYNIYHNQQAQLISPKYRNLISKVERYRHHYLIFELVRIFTNNLKIGFSKLAKASQNTSMSRPIIICEEVDQHSETMPYRLTRAEPLQFSEPEDSISQVSFGINSKNPNMIQISDLSLREEAKSQNYETEEYQKLKSKYLLATLFTKINKTRRDALSSILNHKKSIEELNQIKANIISQAQLRTAQQSKEALKKITLSHTALILSNKLSTIQQSALDCIKSQYYKPSIIQDLNESYTSSYSQQSRRYLPLTLLMILSYIVVGLGAYLYSQSPTPDEPEPSFLIQLNDQTFPVAISENEYLSVFLSKNWCTKCLKPFEEYKKAAKYFSEEDSGVVFTYIKEEKITDLENQFKINTFPSLLFFHNRQLILKQTSKFDSKELVSIYNKKLLEENSK